MLPERIAIVNAFRTPFLKAGTDLRAIDADQLGVYPLKEGLIRSGVRPDDVDDVIVGCCGQPAHAANVGRVIALRAGIPHHVPAVTVHRNCASGMEAISTGAQRLLLNNATIVSTVGVESMSNYPFLFHPKMKACFEQLHRAKTIRDRINAWRSFRFRYLSPTIALKVGLTDPTCGMIMGQTAENVAKMFAISRNDQDQFALNSHLNAIRAQKDGVFDDEIIPVHVPNQFDQTLLKDNGPRPGQTMAALQKLKPFFDKMGTVTIGSSSQITDGAAATLLMRESTAIERGIRPLGYLSAYTYVGCDPATMGLGPTFAIQRLLHSAKIDLKDIDLFEINEAFSAQVLGNIHALDSSTFAKTHWNGPPVGRIPMDKLNINGGAIALGHPLAASGQRIVMTLLHSLHHHNAHRGVAALCVGGGQGAAFLLETH